jgi:hypothetical protein
MNRLLSAVTIAAVGAAAVPGSEHLPLPPAGARFVPLDRALHDLAAASNNWLLARALAGRIAAAPQNRALLADDMAQAVRLGNDALASLDADLLADRRDLDDGWRSAQIEAIVLRVWACTAHIVNAQPPASSGA